MAKKNLNEDALKTNLDTTIDKDLRATVTPTYKQALDDHKKAEDNLEAVLDNRKKALDKLDDKDKDKEEVNDGAKKLHLSESLFEDSDEGEREDDHDFYTLLINELFHTKNYVPTIDVPGEQYDYDKVFVTNERKLDSVASKLGLEKGQDFICLKAQGETEEERKKFLERAKALVDYFKPQFGGLDYKTWGDHKYATIVFNKDDAVTDDYKIRLDMDTLTPVELKQLKNKLNRRLRYDLAWIADEDDFRYAIKHALKNQKGKDDINESEAKYILNHLDVFFQPEERTYESLHRWTKPSRYFIIDSDPGVAGVEGPTEFKNKNEFFDSIEYNHGVAVDYGDNPDSLEEIKAAFEKDADHEEELNGFRFIKLTNNTIDGYLGESLKESMKLNEGAGAGYTIRGWLGSFKLNSVKSFEDDQENNQFYTGYIVDVDATADLSDIDAKSYYYGNVVAEGGSVPVKISKLAISAWGLETENPTLDDMKEYIEDEFVGLETEVVAKYGGGWSHKTFGGDLHFQIKSENTSISEVDCIIENDRVIQAIDDAVTGNDWLTEYVVYDEDGDILENFTDADEAIDFAKKNRGVEVTKRSYQTYLMANLDDEDVSDFGEDEIVWERDYTRSYKYDESVKESCNSHKENKGIKKPLKEKLIKKFTKVVDVDDEDVNTKSFRNAVSNLLGPEELYGGSIEKIKNFKIYHYISAFDDGVDDHIACKFDALVNGDFDETDSRGRFANRRWISFDFSMYNNMFYQAWWDEEDGEPVPSSDVGTIYYKDHSSEIIDALMEDNGENIWLIITELEDALDKYVPVPEFNDGDNGESLKEGANLDESLYSDGVETLDDLADRAKSIYDERGDGDIDGAVSQAIDDGLIYDDDIVGLASYYGSIDTGELINGFYEDLYADLYSRVGDHANESADEDDENADDDVDDSFSWESEKEIDLEDVDDEFTEK